MFEGLIVTNNQAYTIVVAGNDARVPVPETGVYLVKVGNLPAKKVVVIR